MRLFVPGRICLFGEHSDWAGGYRRVNPDIERGFTLISGTDQGIYANVRRHPDKLVLTATTPEGEVHGPREISMDPQTLREVAQRGRFWSYVAGVAYHVQTNYQVQGLVIDNYKTDLPIKKGLSSSAAICVLAARAFNELYDLKLTIRGEMELAYLGEITTPSRCGRMDQGCAFGSRPVLMTFDADYLDTREVQLRQDIHLVIVDLHAQKDTMVILDRLNACYPIAGSEIEHGVQQLLGPLNERITHQAIKALEEGDAERLGELMTEAQTLFDCYAAPACPGELTAPVLHKVLSYEPIQSHIWGGKGVGSQGDGSAQFLARTEAAQRAIVDIIERDLGMSCMAMTMRATPPAGEAAPSASQAVIVPQGADARKAAERAFRVRKGVIPAAGLGTRLFPASKVTKKEMFPVVDRQGIAKPVILSLVEEALDAGIEKVVIIVQEQDLEVFRGFFFDPPMPDVYDKLPTEYQAYALRIQEMSERVSFAIQPSQEGFGHAVYCAYPEIGDEPFLLMLGDHLYHTSNERSCARQMLEVYEQHGTALLGLRHTPESKIGSYGTVAGDWEHGSRLLRITEIAEKPKVDYARSHLRVRGVPEDEYLTVFGLYILPPTVFEYLAEHIANDKRERGEFQLTTALARLQRQAGFLGLMIEGHSYDIGLPRAYVKSLGHLKG